MFRSLVSLLALAPLAGAYAAPDSPSHLPADELRLSIDLIGPAGRSTESVRTTPGMVSSTVAGPYRMTASVRGVVPCSVLIQSIALHPEGESKPVAVVADLPMRIGERVERRVRTSSGDVVAVLELTAAGKCAPGASGHLERPADVQSELGGRVCLGVLVTPLEALRRSRYTRDQAAAVPLEWGLVASIDEETPAAIAGLRDGDLLVAFNGGELRSPPDLTGRVAALQPGDAFEVEVYRGGAIFRPSGRLGALVPDGADLLCRPSPGPSPVRD